VSLASFSASHPPDARVVRINTEYRLPPAKTGSGRKTIIVDEVFLVGDTDRYHIEIELTRKAGMAVRMFRYDTAEALEHPANTPDYELLRVRFPNGLCYDHRTPVIKLTELSVGELVERRLLIFAPLYILKMRRKIKCAKTPGERRQLAALYGELTEALKQEKEAGSMNEVDGNKIEDMTKLLYNKIYGGILNSRRKR
jgi:hypothetical protein